MVHCGIKSANIQIYRPDEARSTKELPEIYAADKSMFDKLLAISQFAYRSRPLRERCDMKHAIRVTPVV